MPARLSVIVAADTWASVRELAAALTQQTVAGEVELVLVGPDADALAPPAGDSGALAAVTVVEQPLIPLGAARAAGVGAASGRVVVLGETHVVPHPCWAQVLLTAHAELVVAVTPAIGNANPDGVLSAVSLHLDYGRWNEGRPRRMGGGIPRNNGSFERERLLALEGRLAEALGPLGDLRRELGLDDAAVLHEPAARLLHLNVSRPGAWLVERYLTGLLTGGARAERWGTARRAAYALAAPAIAIRLLGMAIRRPGRPRGPTALVALASACVVQAGGEAVGYARGRLWESEARMLPYELHKQKYVRRAP